MKRKVISIVIMSGVMAAVLCGCTKTTADSDTVISPVQEAESSESMPSVQENVSAADSIETGIENGSAADSVKSGTAEQPKTESRASSTQSPSVQKEEKASAKAADNQKQEQKETVKPETIEKKDTQTQKPEVNENQNDPDGATTQSPDVDAKTRKKASFSGTNVDENGIRFTTEGGTLDGSNLSIHFSCENHTERELVFTAEDVQVDGKDVDPDDAPWNASLRAGKTLPSAMNFRMDTLKSFGIDDPKTVTFTLAVYDPEDESDDAEDIVDREVTIQIAS